MTERSFQKRVADYRVAASRFETIWAVLLVAGLAAIALLSEKCDCQIPDPTAILLAVAFFGYFAGGLYFALTVDARLRREHRIFCPECGAFLNKIALRKIKRTGTCPQCSKNIGGT